MENNVKSSCKSSCLSLVHVIVKSCVPVQGTEGSIPVRIVVIDSVTNILLQRGRNQRFPLSLENSHPCLSINWIFLMSVWISWSSDTKLVPTDEVDF